MNRGLLSYLRQPCVLPKSSPASPFRHKPTTFEGQFRASWRRFTSTIGDKSGFIRLAPGEGLLFFDNVFPLKTATYDLRYLLVRHDSESIGALITKQYIPKPLMDSGFTISEIIPRVKDGGAFVRFKAPNLEEAESAVAKHLKEKNIKPWFSPFKRVKAYLVRGKPWLEDLYRFPSTRLRVEFINGERGLSQEAIYALFRRYGRIADIIPQAPGSKDVPKSVILQCLRMRSATAAKNCLHGYTVPEIEAVLGKEGGVTLRILYERTMKAHLIRDWLVNHPRIVLPIFAALLAALAVAIFDPMRTWFVKAKVTRALNLSDNTYYNWLKRHTMAMLPIGREHKGMEDLWAVWDERKEQVELLKSWLLETVETFIVVQGPRGSGKHNLVVDTVLCGRENVLIIDCEPINEAHGDSATISAIASQVGYRPVFTWLNTISSLLDLASQGAIGSSAGFSQTLETQFNKILQNTGTALKKVALRDKGSVDKDRGLSDDEYLRAHPEKIPVVVIDNFLHVESNSIIYEKLADWAALMVSANIAHVIFLTNDTSFSKSLARSLPDRTFRSIYLGDAQPESAKRFVLKHITNELEGTANEKALAELDDSIQALGGRLTDLEFLARRIKAGETPRQAVTEIIENSATEILKLYLLEEAGRKKRAWTPEQAWHLVWVLASSDQVRYNQVVIHDLFKSGGEEVLQNLEQAELIAIVTRNGRPWAVKPGKPVYREAFKLLTLDRVLCARMDLYSYAALTRLETATVQKAEDELEKVVPLAGQQPKARAAYLLAKIAEAQAKIEEYEKMTTRSKAVIKEEF